MGLNPHLHRTRCHSLWCFEANVLIEMLLLCRPRAISLRFVTFSAASVISRCWDRFPISPRFHYKIFRVLNVFSKSSTTIYFYNLHSKIDCISTKRCYLKDSAEPDDGFLVLTIMIWLSPHSGLHIFFYSISNQNTT